MIRCVAKGLAARRRPAPEARSDDFPRRLNVASDQMNVVAGRNDPRKGAFRVLAHREKKATRRAIAVLTPQSRHWRQTGGGREESMAVGAETMGSHTAKSGTSSHRGAHYNAAIRAER